MKKNVVTNLLKAALMESCSPRFVDKAVRHPCFENAIQEAVEDLDAFVSKDPASSGAMMTIAQGYSSYKAVVHYRLARALTVMAHTADTDAAELEANVSLISCRGKLMSGADIHPRCRIGRRFVLDHGWGTVIGETAVLGEDCYVLGGVTLGATGISGNPAHKRHPTLGDRVQVGAFARIFGDVCIGDDVFIGPHCIIKQDVEKGSVVTVKSEIQVTRAHRSIGEIHTLLSASL